MTEVESKPEFIDSHAHLDDPRFDEDRSELLARAQLAGLKRIVTVGCWDKVKGFGGLIGMVEGSDFLRCALGVHPHDAADALCDDDPFSPFGLIRELALNHASVVAIGETGLDYHYDNSPRDAQRTAFIRQIELARELNLPLIVHSREAESDTMEILSEYGAGDIGGVLHCFSGSMEMAKAALDLGFYISFSGCLTFKSAEELRRVALSVPVERMLIETDCPYLAPVPVRGKRNEPANVAHIAKVISELKGLSIGDIARITTLNAEELFALDGGPQARGASTAQIAYKIRNSLYLNITNRCSNHCSFCAKFSSYTVKGHYLRLAEEPTEAEVLEAIGPDPADKYDEIVFCGYGEPLIRLDLVTSLGKKLKRMGCRIRIDTDGLANLYHGRNILHELHFVDTVSVSLNAPDSDIYQSIIKTPFGDDAYPAILFFLREGKKHIDKVVATAVSVPGVDMEATRRIAEDDIGVPFRVRDYNEVG